MKRDHLTPEENIKDLVQKVRYYKAMYHLQKAFTKKLIGFLKFLTNSHNEKVSANAQGFIDEFFEMKKQIKEAKNNREMFESNPMDNRNNQAEIVNEIQ
jgi:hypothetical protein